MDRMENHSTLNAIEVKDGTWGRNDKRFDMHAMRCLTDWETYYRVRGREHNFRYVPVLMQWDPYKGYNYDVVKDEDLPDWVHFKFRDWKLIDLWASWREIEPWELQEVLDYADYDGGFSDNNESGMTTPYDEMFDHDDEPETPPLDEEMFDHDDNW